MRCLREAVSVGGGISQEPDECRFVVDYQRIILWKDTFKCCLVAHHRYPMCKGFQDLGFNSSSEQAGVYHYDFRSHTPA